mgnify:CR=1 FL=1
MRLFDKLTGGGIDWQIELDSQTGAFRPADEVSGRVRYMPKGAMDVRSIVLSLVGVEEYVHLVRDREVRQSFGSSNGSSRDEWERRAFTAELFRQDFAASGPASLPAAPGEIPFKFQLPADARPSFDSSVLKMRWQIRAVMDVGGRDPSTQRDLIVVGGAGVPAGDVTVAASVMDQGGQAQIYVEPLPLVVGQQFRGYVETAENLDLGSIRVELRQHVATSGGSGGGILGNTTINLGGNTSLSLGGAQNTNEDRVLWTGQLAPIDAGPTGNRYQFAGQVPLAPVGTLVLPHGSSSATIDVVIGRRLQPDRHITRPVAIVTG